MDSSFIGSLWREKDNRFVRIIRIVSVGHTIGIQTVTFNGKPGGGKTTYAKPEAFGKRYRQEEAL